MVVKYYNDGQYARDVVTKKAHIALTLFKWPLL